MAQQAQWFESDRLPIRILDTKGLEAKDYQQTLADLTAEVERTRKAADEDQQVHIAWICINEGSARVQDAEIDLVKLLNKYEIPAIIALTKHGIDPDFQHDIPRLMSEAGAQVRAVVPVRAVAKSAPPKFGLPELVDRTYEFLPEGRKKAFIAAQKVQLGLKRDLADEAILAGAAATAAAAAIPLPFADAVAIVPVQIAMLLGISNAYGLTIEKSQVTQFTVAITGCLATTLGGRLLAGAVIKFIPGLGSLVGGGVNATIAGTLTRALGKGYSAFLYEFIERTGNLPVMTDVIAHFTGEAEKPVT